MRDAAPKTIYLADYTPYPWIVEAVELTVTLAPEATRVKSRLKMAPNPSAAASDEMFLHGEDLKLVSAAIDGEPVVPTLSPEGLTVAVPAGPFTWEAEVEIAPAQNTALEGLYLSNGMYCTQCEAEGFRKITFYPDRPDVMSVFTVTIEGDAPVMLSNGNPVEITQGRAVWHDPWPKPAYLFALVAGDLVAHPDTFKTMEGRDVELNIYVRAPDLHKCAFAMDALKASMRWDEEVYGRAYDLDIFNIVAVDDFNMGAMENKGLNIFNAAVVLASPDTATDRNFEVIEAIIAHEYFHNWTGNRITCRDWFQLCLKEGLTVFRDAQFTSDMRSPAVKRIEDVQALRARQFPEDQGPLAHPVRPESFQEINNFYTATVYEKGAEVIGMLKTLVGDEAYARALTLYFDRHDGDAATIEDWLKVFEDVTGRDLTQFKRWYRQAGTPHLTLTEAWDPGATDGSGRLTLTLSQQTPPSAATPAPQPFVIPVAVGLIGPDGAEVGATRLLELTEESAEFVFDGLTDRPTVSALRGFTAPVVLHHDLDDAARLHLLAHDTDPFNRWEAGNLLTRQRLLRMIRDGGAPDDAYLNAIKSAATDENLDPASRALMLSAPGASELAAALHSDGDIPDPAAIYAAQEALGQAMAETFKADAPDIYGAHQVSEPYAPDATQSAKRALANSMLSLMTRVDGGKAAQHQFETATNMTQQLAALANLLRAEKGEDALAAFEAQWSEDRLVMDKWFGLQVTFAKPDQAVETAQKLTEHPAFSHTNPNRFRAVLGALAGSHASFHRADGAGYKMLADWLITLDPINPQTTARMCSAFQTWRRYDAARQDMVQAELERILATPNLSRDSTEMLTRIKAA